MRKIWELKKKEAQKEKNASGISPAQIRIQKGATHHVDNFSRFTRN